MGLPEPSPAVAGLTPYAVPRHPAPLDLLLDGIGGLPAPVDLFRSLDDADPERLVRHYPSTTSLAAQLAARHGIDPACVAVTCGGDDALDRACRAFLAPGRTIVLPTPTFEMIERYVRWAGGTAKTLPWPGGPYPTDAVLAAVDATTTLIAVVSPNNPTGAVATSADLRRLSAGAPNTLLLVDLAYVEFADEDLTDLALSLPNALVFRTLSKAWGLAGLRVGYVAGPAPAVAWLRSAGHPYTVSGPSTHLAARRLATGQGVVDDYVFRVRDQRDGLGALLAELGSSPLPSQANFVFTRDLRAPWIRDGLAGLGIGVRTWPDHPTLGDAVRISVPGEPEALDRLERGLRAVLRPEALLFDMDGVLADVSGSYRRAIVATAAAFGTSVDESEIRAAKAAGDANNDWKLTQRLLAAHGVEVPLDRVIEVFESLYLGTGDAPGFRSTERLLVDRGTLVRLKGRVRLAVVTGRPRAQALHFLETHGLTDLFEVVVAMEDGPAKPDPFPVTEALRRLGLTRAWMIGDTVDDVVAARAAGVVPVGVVAPGEEPARVASLLGRAGAARVWTNLNTNSPSGVGPSPLEELLP